MKFSAKKDRKLAGLERVRKRLHGLAKAFKPESSLNALANDIIWPA
jgi:hypothetical protein